MILKIVDLGDCSGIALTKGNLEVLGVREGDALYFKKTQDGFHVTKADEAFVRQMEAADEVMKAHRDTLERLGSD